MTLTENKALLVYVCLGLIIGIGLDGLIYQKIIYVFPYIWLTLFGLMLALAFDFRHSLRIIFSSALVAAITCSPFFLTQADQSGGFSANFIIPIVTFPLVAMIAHSFHFAYHLDNQFRIRYTSLFYVVWNTIPLLLIAVFFTMIATFLIQLCGGIFSLFKIKSIAHFILVNEHFRIISTTTLLITGIGIARQNLKILDSFRTVILKLFAYLYPFLIVITAIYLGLYLVYFLSHQPPKEAKWILLPISILGIIYFNAVFQDGKKAPYTSPFLNKVTQIHLIMLLVTTILATYFIYPDTDSAINALLLLCLLVLYGICYSVAAFLPSPSNQNWIKQSNVCIALVYVIAFLIINNPIHPFYDKYKSKQAKRLHNTSSYSDKSMRQQSQKTLENDSTLSELGFHWQDKVNSRHQVQLACRGKLADNQTILGILHQNQCLSVKDNRLVTLADYQQLSGDPATMAWYPQDDAIPMVLGWQVVYNSVKPVSICRVKMGNDYQFGISQNHICMIISQKTIRRRYNGFDLLTLDVAQFPDKSLQQIDIKLKQQGLAFRSPPLADFFVAGINEKGKIGICRSQYNQNLLIGNYQENQCTLSQEGRILKPRYFEVLTSTNAKATVSWQPLNLRNRTNADSAIALGFTKNKRGARLLPVCRTIYDNRIYIGNAVKGKCYILVEDQDVAVRSGIFTILSAKKT